jgi:hypothetical protein
MPSHILGNIQLILTKTWNTYSVGHCSSYLSYPTFKIHFKNGDSHQAVTQAIRQELLLTTLHPLPTGSRIIGGQEKSQSIIKG